MYSRVIFFFNDTATTEIYTYCHTLSLHAALPICKSTLFKLITGKETPDGGTIEVGDTVKLGYVDQSRDHLNPDHNVWEEISGGHDLMTIGKHELQTRASVGARSEEHTSEHQSLIRSSYAVFRVKTQNTKKTT